MSGFAYELSIWLIPVLLAITLHEAAHAWAAWKLGDDTAYRAGRVTFNPVPHIDPIGTLLLPATIYLAGAPFVVGYAKPVPVAFHRLRRPRLGTILVAGAGPAANIALAVASLMVHAHAPQLPPAVAGWVEETAFRSVLVNIILVIFNMLPIPPLDGGRILMALLPRRLIPRTFDPLLEALERHGILLLLAFLFVLPWLLSRVGIIFNPVIPLIWQPTKWILTGLLGVV